MRNRVDSARGAHPSGQRHGQINVVDDSPRQDLRVTPRLLLPVGRLAQDRRHLRTRIRRRDADVRQPRPDTNRLPQPDGAPAAHRDDRVRADGLDVRQGRLGDVRRSVHRRSREDAAAVPAAEPCPQALDVLGLLRRREEYGGFEVLAGELLGEFGDASLAEDDPRGRRVVDEAFHGVVGLGLGGVGTVKAWEGVDYCEPSTCLWTRLWFVHVITGLVSRL